MFYIYMVIIVIVTGNIYARAIIHPSRLSILCFLFKSFPDVLFLAGVALCLYLQSLVVHPVILPVFIPAYHVLHCDGRYIKPNFFENHSHSFFISNQVHDDD